MHTHTHTHKISMTLPPFICLNTKKICGAADIHPKAHSTDKQKTLFTGSFHSEPFMSCEFPLKAPISMNKLIKANV